MPLIDVNTPVLDRAHFMTSPFGFRTINGKKTMHNGIDLVGYDGKSTCTATILAYMDGKVIAEGFDATKGYFIELRHSTCVSVYYHLSGKPWFSVGDFVRKGDALGVMGNTGNSTGAHLHFGIKETTWVNPLIFLQAEAEMTREEIKSIVRETITEIEEEKKSEPCADWAKDSLTWAQKNEILFGDGNGNLMPKATCTREMIATFLARFYKLINK